MNFDYTIDIVKVLIKFGADPTIQSYDHKSALEMSAIDSDIYKVLKSSSYLHNNLTNGLSATATASLSNGSEAVVASDASSEERLTQQSLNMTKAQVFLESNFFLIAHLASCIVQGQRFTEVCLSKWTPKIIKMPRLP